jgi:CAAX protease family protein
MAAANRSPGLQIESAWFRLPTAGSFSNRSHSMTFMVNPRRAALDLFVFLAAFFVLWTVRATWFYAVDESITSPVSRAAYSNFLKLVLWVLPAAAFAYWLRSTPPAKYLGLSVLPTLNNGLVCLAVTVVFLLTVTLFDLTIGKKSFSGAGLSSLSVTLALLQLVISPLFEEILFRGLVMKELLALLPAHLANALTSLLFVGAHLPYWLSHGGPTPAMLTNALGVFVFSIVACWLFAKTSSIWPPTFAHIANNLLSSSLAASHM